MFSIVLYGVWIIGAEGRVELEGDPMQMANEIEGEKENIIRRKLNGFHKEGWHWRLDWPGT